MRRFRAAISTAISIASSPTRTSRSKNAVKQARFIAERFPVVSKGLFLLGRPGVGKTHLAAAVLKQVIRQKRAHALFYDTRQLLRVIRETYNPVVRTTEMDVLCR